MIGKRLGPYEVLAKLGEGGMGEVYRATDTNLARQVAIKVLPEAVAQDAERLARFDREARTLAALNHPNIAQIYGLEKSGGQVALVMELVEGPTLADVIGSGVGRGAWGAGTGDASEGRTPHATRPTPQAGHPKGLPLSDALPIAKQIAEALEAAHEQGIIHRDLKPANIKVKDDGTVKVLDFGLAKALGPEGASAAAGSSPNLSMSPTITTPAHLRQGSGGQAMTQMGMILGTAAYMAPEQARGRPVGKRADIWAFGVVLYEMLTGRRAFEGEDVSATLADVIRGEPDWDRLPDGLPPSLVVFLRRCLEKDPAARVRDIGDVRLALDGAFDTATPETAITVDAPPVRRWALPVAAAIVAGVLVSLAAWSAWPTPVPGAVTRFDVMVPADRPFRNLGRPVMALSPDGRALVYNAAGGLYLRRMDEPEARLMAGTEAALTSPFFSPDGQSVGYFQQGQLKRIATSGGAPVVIGPATNPFGVSWATDGTILYGEDRGILRVSADGGTPEVAIEAQGEVLVDPQLLPDGDSVLFTVISPVTSTDAREGAQIVVQSLGTGERTVLLGGMGARYVSTGHLVYTQGDGVGANALFAVPFDPERRVVTGRPMSVEPRVSLASNVAAGNYDVSNDGTMALIPDIGSNVSVPKQLTWFDRSGTFLEAVGEPAALANFDLARDDSRVVEERQAAIWMTDLRRGQGISSIFRDGFGLTDPVFSPDGSRVAFSSGASGGAAFGQQVVAVSAAGGEPVSIFTAPDGRVAWLEDWSPDGQRLALLLEGGILPDQAVVVAVEGGQTPEVLDEASDVDEIHFSPDGRWVAYGADHAGDGMEVFVVPYPATGMRIPVSGAAGGGQPRWRQDGRELFYLSRDGVLMSVEVDGSGSEFVAGTPVPLFQTDLDVDVLLDQYAVARDGQRFLVAVDEAQDAEEAAPRRITVVLNWFEELKRLVPADPP